MALLIWLDALLQWLGLRSPPSIPAADRPTPEVPPKASVRSVPKAEEAAKWMAIARSFDGLREIPGKKHETKILEFFSEIGHPELQTDETSWCAAFVGTCLQRAGYVSTGSPVARSYESWGRVLNKPIVGCVVVFKNPKSSWQGHVGFYVGEDATGIYVLGGNQGNAVNVRRYPRKSASLELIGYRWPTTLTNSRTIQAATVGTVSATVALTGQALSEGLAQVGNSALPFGAELKALAVYSSILGLLGGVVCLMAYAIIIYARVQDLREKRR
jgi:uncharacterized protein (TIGR02594 family)